MHYPHKTLPQTLLSLYNSFIDPTIDTKYLSNKTMEMEQTSINFIFILTVTGTTYTQAPYT